ncbi:MAG TPA: energy transducer TonB [Thermoanaerobaculia bacterium]|nr:energy transducer TonB [Thermoanaerobaculia bacterium]
MIENIRFRLVSRLALAVALVLPALPARAADSPSRDVTKALARAEKLLVRGDSPEACKEYRRASELSQGQSVPSWIGLEKCSERLGDFDQAVDMGRKARSAASTPEEQVNAELALGCALLGGPDAQAKSQEAADLFKEAMAHQEEARAGYFMALKELHRDGEAAEFFRSLPEASGGLGSLPCSNPKLADAVSESVHALDPDAPLRVGSEVTRPEIIHQVKPQVPDELHRHHGFSGTVILEVIIDREGQVQNPRVLRGQPYGLSESAVASVKQWRFKPATFKGRPVNVYYVLTVRFQEW